MTDTGRHVTVSIPGFSIATILGVVFVILKLIGVITWSWLWVLAPFWIPLAVVLLFLGVLGIMFLVSLAVDKRNATKHKKARIKNGRL